MTDNNVIRANFKTDRKVRPDEYPVKLYRMVAGEEEFVFRKPLLLEYPGQDMMLVMAKRICELQEELENGEG